VPDVFPLGRVRLLVSSVRKIVHFRAADGAVFGKTVGEVTRPERLKTGAKSQWGEPYRQRAEFFALPARPFAGFRYVVKP
jgi:hypothetical protein